MDTSAPAQQHAARSQLTDVCPCTALCMVHVSCAWCACHVRCTRRGARGMCIGHVSRAWCACHVLGPGSTCRMPKCAGQGLPRPTPVTGAAGRCHHTRSPLGGASPACRFDPCTATKPAHTSAAACRTCDGVHDVLAAQAVKLLHARQTCKQHPATASACASAPPHYSRAGQCVWHSCRTRPGSRDLQPCPNTKRSKGEDPKP